MDTKLQVIVLCHSIKRESQDFLRRCGDAGMIIKDAGYFTYDIRGIIIRFKPNMFKSIAGERVDVLVGSVSEIERKAVISRSQYKDLGEKITTKNGLFKLLEELKESKVEYEKKWKEYSVDIREFTLADLMEKRGLFEEIEQRCKYLEGKTITIRLKKGESSISTDIIVTGWYSRENKDRCTKTLGIVFVCSEDIEPHIVLPELNFKNAAGEVVNE